MDDAKSYAGRLQPPQGCARIVGRPDVGMKRSSPSPGPDITVDVAKDGKTNAAEFDRSCSDINTPAVRVLLAEANSEIRSGSKVP